MKYILCWDLTIEVTKNNRLLATASTLTVLPILATILEFFGFRLPLSFKLSCLSGLFFLIAWAIAITTSPEVIREHRTKEKLRQKIALLKDDVNTRDKEVLDRTVHNLRSLFNGKDPKIEFEQEKLREELNLSLPKIPHPEVVALEVQLKNWDRSNREHNQPFLILTNLFVVAGTVTGLIWASMQIAAVF